MICLAAGIHGWEGYVLFSKDSGLAWLHPVCLAPLLPMPCAGVYGMEPVATPWPTDGGATASHPLSTVGARQLAGCSHSLPSTRPSCCASRSSITPAPSRASLCTSQGIAWGALTHTSGCSELCLPSELCFGEGSSHGCPWPNAVDSGLFGGQVTLQLSCHCSTGQFTFSKSKEPKMNKPGKL